MSKNINEYGQIQCPYPQLYYQGEYYLDYSSLMAITEQSSTSLFRLIKSLENVPVFRYKNRSYFKTKWCYEFWKHVGEQNHPTYQRKILP